jgi:hypothetical protein
MRQSQLLHDMSDIVRVVACIVLDEETCRLPKAAPLSRKAAPLLSWIGRGEVLAPQVRRRSTGGSGLSRFNSRCVLCWGMPFCLPSLGENRSPSTGLQLLVGPVGFEPTTSGLAAFACRVASAPGSPPCAALVSIWRQSLSRPSCPYLFDGSRRRITPRYGWLYPPSTDTLDE